MGFLIFVLKCFFLFARLIIGLGYPLCASIRAIETNSNYHMRKLITYWIIFSLISLFELAFAELIEWIPLWPYIKLGTICWLVLPHFKGALYCYKSFVYPCLSVNLEEVWNRLYKQYEASLEEDKLLSAVDTYVSVNGTEALEKLIASKGSRTDFGVEGIKAVAEAEKKEITLNGSTTDCGVEVGAVAEAEKNEIMTVESYCHEFISDQKDINRVQLSYKNALVAANWVKPAEAILVQAEKKTIGAVEGKELTVPPFPPADAEKVVSEKVQNEWTCAICQVTASCQANLNSHLVGKKHIAKCEELKSKAVKRTGKDKASSSSSPASKIYQANQDSKKYLSGDQLNHSGSRYLRNWCPYCAVICSSKIDFLSHLNGKKHLAKVQESEEKTG